MKNENLLDLESELYKIGSFLLDLLVFLSIFALVN